MPSRGHHMRRRKATPAISSTAVHSSIKRYIMMRSSLHNCVDMREMRKDYADGDGVVPCVEPMRLPRLLAMVVSRAEEMPLAPVSKLIQSG